MEGLARWRVGEVSVLERMEGRKAEKVERTRDENARTGGRAQDATTSIVTSHNPLVLAITVASFRRRRSPEFCPPAIRRCPISIPSHALSPVSHWLDVAVARPSRRGRYPRRRVESSRAPKPAEPIHRACSSLPRSDSLVAAQWRGM